MTTPTVSEKLFVNGRLSNGWATVFVGALALMFGPSSILTTTFAVFAAGLKAKTQWDHSSIAYASTLISLVVLISSPVQGFLADRFGGRRIVLWSIPLFGAAVIGLAHATGSIAQFYLFCLLATAFGIGLWPAPLMKVASGWFSQRVGIAFAIMISGAGLSTAALPILLGWSFEHLGWSTSYTAMGIMLLVVVWPVTFLWLREAGTPAPPRGGPAAKGPSRQALRAALRHRSFWLAAVTFLVFGSVSAAVLVHGIAIFTDAGVPAASALRIQALVGVSALVARIVTGWVLDHAQVRVVGTTVFAVATLYFLLASSELTVPLAMVAAMCGGLVIGAEFDILGVLIRRHLGIEVFGRAYGIIFAGFHLGGACGSGGLAFILHRTGSFDTGIYLLLAASVSGAILFCFIQKDPRPTGLEQNRA